MTREPGGWPGALADLLLPVSCAGCALPGDAWCPRCRAGFGRSGWLALPDLAPVLALAPYAGSAREAVLAYKERGRRDLAAGLAGAVRAALAAHDVPAAAVVPAPSRRSAARARGGDHVLRLARTLVRTSPGAALARALTLRAGARDSVGLDADARAANLARHLRLRPRGLEGPAAGLPVVLLDDVLTTGATARAASRLLAAAGRPPVAVVVLTAVTGASAATAQGSAGRAAGPVATALPGDPDGGRRRPGRHSDGGANAA